MKEEGQMEQQMTSSNGNIREKNKKTVVKIMVNELKKIVALFDKDYEEKKIIEFSRSF